jgi:hypothetical protein
MLSGAGEPTSVVFDSSIVRLSAIGLTYAFPTVKSNTAQPRQPRATHAPTLGRENDPICAFDAYWGAVHPITVIPFLQASLYCPSPVMS